MKPTNVAGDHAAFTVTENGTVLAGEGTFTMPTPFLGVLGMP